jgi:hypothetical protein
MSYTEFKDGYALEGSFKDGTTLDSADDTAYLLGQLATQNDWPSPVFETISTATGVNAKEVGAGLLTKVRARMDGMLSLMVQDGIVCWLAMGGHSVAGGDPYVHTIAPTTDGTQLPSIVLQHEEKGTATNEEYQFQGVKVDSIVLSHDMNNPELDFLMAKLEIKGAFAKDPAFALDVDPALPATANTDPYINLTRKWNTTDPAAGTSIAGLEKIEIVIANGLTPIYAHSYDTGVYTGQWPYMFLEAPKKAYRIKLLMHPNTIERQLWDELLASSNTKDAVFKWTRDTNDYITVTATDCQVIDVPKHTPETDKLNLEEVVLLPRAVSIEVKDAIAGGAYGE